MLFVVLLRSLGKSLGCCLWLEVLLDHALLATTSKPKQQMQSGLLLDVVVLIPLNSKHPFAIAEVQIVISEIQITISFTTAKIATTQSHSVTHKIATAKSQSHKYNRRSPKKFK